MIDQINEYKKQLSVMDKKAINLLNQFPDHLIHEVLNEKRRELVSVLNSDKPEISIGLIHFIDIVENVIKDKDFKLMKVVN